jgi:hypothetical protein
MGVAGRHEAPAASPSVSIVRTGDWVVPRDGRTGLENRNPLALPGVNLEPSSLHQVAAPPKAIPTSLIRVLNSK